MFPILDSALREERLSPPKEKVRLLIDTDAANEIDDQFALVWALLSKEQMSVEAVTAEPFSFAHHRPHLLAAQEARDRQKQYHEYQLGGFQGWIERLHAQGKRAEDVNFTSVEEGMALSYQEILTIYDKLGISAKDKVFEGAARYMENEGDCVLSDAVDVIIDCAKSSDSPLYIAAMGCVSNIASALIKAPEIIQNLIVIWTAGYPTHAPHTNLPALNLVQDVPAARILFNSGVPLIYLPGYHVGAQLRISLSEMEAYVKGKGAIGDYLHHLYTHNPIQDMYAIDDRARRTWVIWDMIDIAWLIDPNWVPTFLTESPILDDELCWQKAGDRHSIREAYDIQRDQIFLDFYDKLAKLS